MNTSNFKMLRKIRQYTFKQKNKISVYDTENYCLRNNQQNVADCSYIIGIAQLEQHYMDILKTNDYGIKLQIS